MSSMKQRLSHLLLGQKGGQNRTHIIELLKERPFNINQIAEKLSLNYRTVKHHMGVLEKSGLVVSSQSGGYGEVYFLSPEMERNISLFDDVIKKLRDVTATSSFFHMVLEQSNLAVIVTDMAGEVFFWNKSAERLYGYKAEDVLGTACPILAHDGELDELLSRAGKGEGAVASETRGQTASGEGIDIWVSVTPIREHGGKLLGFSMSSKDISKRKRSEMALAASEERFRNIFENSPLGIYQTTPNGKITAANPALVSMLGFSSFKELAKRNLEKDGFHPQHLRDEFKELMARDGRVVGRETVWLRKDGSPVFIRETASAVRDREGHILFYEGTVEDLTERREAEKEIERLMGELSMSKGGVKKTSRKRGRR